VHELLVQQGEFSLIPDHSLSPTYVLVHRAPLIELKRVSIESSHHPT